MLEIPRLLEQRRLRVFPFLIVSVFVGILAFGVGAVSFGVRFRFTIGFGFFCRTIQCIHFVHIHRRVSTEEIGAIDGNLLHDVRLFIGQGFDCRILLHFTNQRTTHNSHREHADSGNGIQCESAAFWTLLRHHTQHGGPEECFTESVQRGENKDRRHAYRTGQHEEAHNSESRGCNQQTNRRKFFHNRSRKEKAENHHDARGVNQNPQRIPTGCLHRLLHDSRYRTIGSQLSGR